MAKVYIPQVTERYDHGLCRPIPTIDWTPAAKFGLLVEVLDRGDNAVFLNSLKEKIADRLSKFDVASDFLVASGDPAIIASCAAYLAKNKGAFTLLKWDKKGSIYIPTTIE